MFCFTSLEQSSAFIVLHNTCCAKLPHVRSQFYSEIRSLQRILRDAATLADELGVQCYVVGGFVRDLLLHRPNDDIDFVVEVSFG